MTRRMIRWGAAALLGVAMHRPTAPPAPMTEGTAVPAAMVAAGQPYAGWTATGRRFLAFDAAGDGRAVEVVGDLRTAGAVVIVVPGVGTTLADFDRGLGGVARRAPAAQARAIAAEVRAADPRARVAVVAWLGYDPPEGMGVAAARWERAAQGVPPLRDLVADVLAARPTATVTVVGHSYGALVAGLAAPALDPRVTDLVALGAPGMGADRAAALGGGARVWAAEAADDWVARLPQLRVVGLGHGRRPVDAAFGARRLPTEGVRGHDGYLVPGSATLRAIARIALGRLAEVPR